MNPPPPPGPIDGTGSTARTQSPQMLDDASGERRWHVGTLWYTRAGLTVLFSLLLWGDFAYQMKERSAGPMLQILVKEVFHSSNTEMQMFMLFIPQAIIIIVGPVISYRSDRHRGKWGRRIPFLMLSTPFAFLAMVGIGLSPAMGRSLHAHLRSHSPGLDPTIRLCFGFFWIIFEVATVAANAVLGGLINDVVPRALIGRFYGLFRALSLIAGMIVTYKLLGLTKTHYVAMFLGIGLLYGGGFTLMCLTVKEGEYPPPQDRSLEQHRGFVNDMWVYLRQSFSNPYYIFLMIAMMFGALTFNPVNNFSQPFATSLHIDNDTYGKYIGITYGMSLAASYWIGSLADRFHPLRIGIVAMLLYAVLTFFGTYVSSNPKVLFTLPLTKGGVPFQWFAIALIAHTFLSGTYFTCTASLGQRLFPRETFAQYAAAAGIVNAVCTMVYAIVIGKYFDWRGPVYHQTYAIGCGMALAGAATMLIVHGYFMKLGGPKNYVAPEEPLFQTPRGFPIKPESEAN